MITIITSYMYTHVQQTKKVVVVLVVVVLVVLVTATTGRRSRLSDQVFVTCARSACPQPPQPPATGQLAGYLVG